MTTVIFKNTEQNKRFYDLKLKPLIAQGIVNISSYHNSLDSFHRTIITRHLSGTYGSLIKTDISNFFESIPKDEIIAACNYLSTLTNVPVGEIITTCCKQIDRRLFIPVGYSTSSFLAEYIVSQKINPAYREDIIRYVDDLIIFRNRPLPSDVSKNPIALADFTKSVYFVNANWIILKPEKTKYITPSMSVKFLGTNFLGSSNSFVVKNITGRSGMKKYNHYAFKLAKELKFNKKANSIANNSILNKLVNENKTIFSQKDYAIVMGLINNNVHSSWFINKTNYFMSKIKPIKIKVVKATNV